MKRFTILTLVLTLVTAGAAFADKPAKAGKGSSKAQSKGQDKVQSKGLSQAKGNDTRVTVRFGDNDRNAARDYFSSQYGRGNCPPGLAKKNNGCLPPGQAKKRYQIGQRLSHEVIYVDAPSALVVRLSPPLSGQKYVIVDGDLVKLAIGTMLVVDAIDGLIH